MKNLKYGLVILLIVVTGCSKSDEKLPAVAIVGWGDSLTEGHGGDGTTYLSDLSDSTGIFTLNKGIRSETSTQIKDRMIADGRYWSYPTIIWAGTNNLDDSVTVKADIATMVTTLNHNNYIVLGMINGGSYIERKGKWRYSNIINLNNQLAAIYGTHFIDIRKYLVANYNPDSAQDVQDHTYDTVPQSLRYDQLHPNKQGYALVAKKIKENIDLLISKQVPR